MKFDQSEVDQLQMQFSKLNFLVIGDVMLDKYLLGQVDRISPEAPVPVLTYHHSENKPGGAANVATNLRKLGARVSIFSVIGGDPEGKTLLNLLDQEELGTEGMIISKARPTTYKTRVMAGNQHLLRVDREVAEPISADEEKLLFEKFVHTLNLERWDGLIFQDYNKGVLSRNLIGKIMGRCQKQSIKTAVDPKYHNFFAYQGIDLFKPNLHELRANLSFDVTTSAQSLAKAATYVRKKTASKIILFTLSDKGIFIDHNGIHHIIPAKKREITDVCGAGDAVISVASLAYAAGLSTYEIAYWSNLAGSIACEYPGVVPVDFIKIRKDLHGSKIKDQGLKIKDEG